MAASNHLAFDRKAMQALFRAQDALITELNHAHGSIDLCMFDLGFLKGRSGMGNRR